MVVHRHTPVCLCVLSEGVVYRQGVYIKYSSICQHTQDNNVATVTIHYVEPLIGEGLVLCVGGSAASSLVPRPLLVHFLSSHQYTYTHISTYLKTQLCVPCWNCQVNGGAAIRAVCSMISLTPPSLTLPVL